MAHDVFISHSAKDKTIADAVCATLEANGVRCFIAPRDIMPGAEWGEAILDAINDSRLMIIIVSSNANASHQIKREVERAVNRGAILIPFRIEDVPLSKSLEFFISTAHWLDALTPPLEIHLQHLAETARLLLKRTGAPTACARCGGNIPAASRFCPLCGEPRPEPPLPPAPVPAPVPVASRSNLYLKIALVVFIIAIAVGVVYLITKPGPIDSANSNTVNSNTVNRSVLANRRVQERVTDSIEAYNEAIQRNPQDVNAYLSRGELYRTRKEYDRAIADHNEAIRLDPKNAMAYSSRARVYMDMSDYDRAIADYKEAVKINPADERSRRTLGRLEDLRNVNRTRQ